MILKPDTGSAAVCDAYITADNDAWEILQCVDKDNFYCRRMVMVDHETTLRMEQARLPWNLVGVQK